MARKITEIYEEDGGERRRRRRPKFAQGGADGEDIDKSRSASTAGSKQIRQDDPYEGTPDLERDDRGRDRAGGEDGDNGGDGRARKGGGDPRGKGREGGSDGGRGSGRKGGSDGSGGSHGDQDGSDDGGGAEMPEGEPEAGSGGGDGAQASTDADDGVAHEQAQEQQGRDGEGGNGIEDECDSNNGADGVDDAPPDPSEKAQDGPGIAGGGKDKDEGKGKGDPDAPPGGTKGGKDRKRQGVPGASDMPDATSRSKKDRDKAISGMDREGIEGPDLGPKKKKKDDGPLKKVQKAAKAVKAAMSAMRALIFMKMMLMLMKAAAAIAHAVAQVLSFLAAVGQAVMATLAAVGIAMVVGIVGIIVIAAVVVAAVVATGSTTAERDGAPCIEEADWDSLDLEYLDTGDIDKSQKICARIIYGTLRQMGYDNNNIAGILYNFWGESGIDPTILENNRDNRNGGSWRYSDVYAHADEPGMPQYYAEYGLRDECPDGSMSRDRWLYSPSLHKLLALNADAGSASSRFGSSLRVGGWSGTGLTTNVAQDFMNMKGLLWNRPSDIEQDFGFQDIRNTVAGQIVRAIDTSQVGTRGEDTFKLTGTVDKYNSIGQVTGSGALSHDVSINIGPEIGTGTQAAKWGASYPTHIAGQSYKSDWMYCMGGVHVRSFGDHSVAQLIDGGSLTYKNIAEAGADAAGDDPGTPGATENKVIYTDPEGNEHEFDADEFDSYLVDNIIWGWCDEHQCSGIHQFKANAPSTYFNPTWCYWCTECWQASWYDTADYWYLGRLTSIYECVLHPCRHSVTSLDTMAPTPYRQYRSGLFDLYYPEDYMGRVAPGTGIDCRNGAPDKVDSEHLRKYNAVVVTASGAGAKPHRVHIPHMADFRIWSTDQDLVYRYWIGDRSAGPAAAGVINVRGAGLGGLTNDRFKGCAGQDLHAQESASGFRGAGTGPRVTAMMNNRSEVIDGVTVTQPGWINPAVKNAGEYNYTKSRGKHWYEIDAQLQWILDEKEGDCKAAFMNDWAYGREPNAKDAAEIFLVVWEMGLANDARNWQSKLGHVPSAIVKTHVPGDDNPCPTDWRSACEGWLASRDYSRSMSESIVQAAQAVSDRGTERAEGKGYCESVSHGNTDIAHTAALLGWGDHEQAKATPGTQLFVCVRNNVFDPSEPHYHSNKGHYPTQKYVYQSCDISVATAVRWSGADDTYPGYACVQQLQYLNAHKDKWMQVGSGSFEPGDILITEGHVRIYVGEDVINEVRPELAGQGYAFYEGSLNTHSPWFSKPDPSYDNSFRVFRHVGTSGSSKWKDVHVCDGASMDRAGTAHSMTG